MKRCGGEGDKRGVGGYCLFSFLLACYCLFVCVKDFVDLFLFCTLQFLCHKIKILAWYALHWLLYIVDVFVVVVVVVLVFM